MTSTPLHWQVARLHDRRLGGAAAEWDTLLQRTWGAHPLLASDFIGHLLAHFGTGAEYLCSGRDDDGQTVAMHLLVRRRPWLWTSFSPMQAPVGLSLARGPVGVTALLKALPGYAAQLDIISFDSRFGDFGCDRPWPNTTWHALTTSIRLTGGFDAYWAGRSSKLQQNMRRYERKAAELGEVRLVCVRSANEMRAAVDRYVAIESTGWKARAGTALIPASEQTTFYGDVMEMFAASSGAEAFELWAGDRQLASRLAVRAGDVIVMLKTTYDEHYASVAPGHVLLARTIEHLFQHHPGRVVEFYTNATAEQRMWGTGEHPIRHATFFRHPSWAVATMAARSTRGAIGTSARRAAGSARDRLQVDVLSSVSGLSQAAVDLMDRAERNHGPAAGTDWYRILGRHVPDLGLNTRLAVLQRDGAPVAVLPLVVRRDGWLGGQRLDALANYYTALYAPAFDDSLTVDELAVLLRGAQAQLGRAAEFRLKPMDPHAREFSLLRAALLRTGCVIAPFYCFGNWTHRPLGGFDDYIAQRPGAVRTSLKRMPKRFAAAGGTLEIVTGGDRLADAKAAYQRVYAASWKKPEPYPGFMPDLIDLCARRGWLRLGIAWLGDLPIAAQVWIVAHGRAEIYKLAYDEAHKSHAAGTVLTAHLMRHAIDVDRVREIDYLIGDDEYKKSWMDRRQERWGLSAFNPLTLGGLASSLMTAAAVLVAPWRNFGSDVPRSARRAQGHPRPESRFSESLSSNHGVKS